MIGRGRLFVAAPDSFSTGKAAALRLRAPIEHYRILGNLIVVSEETRPTGVGEGK
jgi:hypothetical protein